jgi:ubiquinone biosynthesis protein
MIHPLKTLKTYRRIKRYRVVIFTLLKYGFDDIVDRLDLLSLVRKRKPSGLIQPRSQAPTAQRFREALSELGPTFVKLGQLLSTRPDILPESFIFELEKLQDDVPPIPFSDVVEVFQEEFNSSPEDIFSNIDSEPTASGSMAQVHKARLQDGTIVAVKVQRPGIVDIINTDLSILLEIAALMERHIPELYWINPVALVNHFSTSITRETDFVSEFHATAQFANNFSEDKTVVIPKVFKEYSSEKILVMDFIEGIKISNLEAIADSNLDRKILAKNGANAILKEIFEHQFFHGDPHPGNLFALDNNRIAVIDFGMVGYLDDKTTRLLGKIFSGVIRKDIDSIIHSLEKMRILPAHIDMTAFRFDLKGFVNRYYGSKISEVDLDEIIGDSLRIVRTHHIVLPANLASIGRMLVISTGIARKLDPDFDMLEEAKPYVMKLVSSQFDFHNVSRETISLVDDYYSIFKFLPANLKTILNKLKKGETTINLKHQGIDRMIREIDRSSNRLSFSMIVAALIVGSSLIIHMDKGPTLYGFAALGLGGYLVAGVLGLWLIISILRSGKI